FSFAHQLNGFTPEEDLSVFLFRMYQEMINNTLKHAEASAANLTISHSENSLHIRFHDNGKGFNPSASTVGQGLKNIGERCRIIGASWSLDSTPQEGTSIEIQLPI